MKIISKVCVISFIFLLGLPVFVFAAGLIPCGGSTPCTLCHVFVLIKNLINVLSAIAIVLLGVGALVAAVLFITAAGDPGRISAGRQAITSAIVGFIIVLLAWVIVNTIVGFATGKYAGEKATIFTKPWDTIDCTVTTDESTN
jgi:hypothetical protein